jgi:phosphate starvation-inducible protein PhoH and related proteins
MLWYMGQNGKRNKKKKHCNYQINEGINEYYENKVNLIQINNEQLSKPRNENQKKYSNYLNSDKVKVVLATGPAGTGKTMFPSQKAIQLFMNGDINKIIITRPVVSADEEIGFLPGTLEDKMEPWMRPIYDIFYDFMHPKYLKKCLEEKSIEIVPLAYMRGRTFKNCWIIADEMQNATVSQMKMILTRIGSHSKIIMTGDLEQHDRKSEFSGLDDFMKRCENYKGEGIKTVRFVIGDIEREPIIRDILRLYQD